MKSLTLLLATLLSMNIWSQAPAPVQIVKDPAANVTLGQRLQQGYQQIEQGVKQIEMLEKSSKLVSKVSSAVRDIQEIKDIYEIQRKNIEKSRKFLKQLSGKNNLKNQELDKIAGTINKSIESGMNVVETVNKLVTNNIFSMKDAERIDLIRKLKEDIQDDGANIEIAKLEAKRAMEQRAMRSLFGN